MADSGSESEWWFSADRTWHQGSPPEGWWQAADRRWHPPERPRQAGPARPTPPEPPMALYGDEPPGPRLVAPGRRGPRSRRRTASRSQATHFWPGTGPRE